VAGCAQALADAALDARRVQPASAAISLTGFAVLDEGGPAGPAAARARVRPAAMQMLEPPPLPAPPMMQPSSTVTSSACSRARRSTRAVSSGFTKRMFATVASRAAPASSAG
jgi:hypothetical protein